LGGPAKDTFVKAVLKHYGKVDGQAQTHKVMQARARFLHRAGRLLLQWPDSKVVAACYLFLNANDEFEEYVCGDLCSLPAF
jgi:hypothetical protein